jgi:hypothetical protein
LRRRRNGNAGAVFLLGAAGRGDLNADPSREAKQLSSKREICRMFTSKSYRSKAAEFAELAKTGDPEKSAEFRKRERSFTSLADNEEWLAENFEKTLHGSGERGGPGTLAATEEHVLRCLGAAVIMQWNTIPKELQRELFDSAGSIGKLADVATLRGQIARFLHKHKDDEQ